MLSLLLIWRLSTLFHCPSSKKPAVQKDSRFLVLSYVLLKQAKRVAVGKDYVFLQILFLVVYVVYAPAAAQCFV